MPGALLTGESRYVDPFGLAFASGVRYKSRPFSQLRRHSQVVRRGSAKYRGWFFNGSTQGASPQKNTSIAPARYGAGAMCFEGTREDSRGHERTRWDFEMVANGSRGEWEWCDVVTRNGGRSLARYPRESAAPIAVEAARPRPGVISGVRPAQGMVGLSGSVNPVSAARGA